ncbi:MAG: glycosyltransferase family 4 protein [Symplocastrum torsivum CPER-KK1]|uniref:Glycosyltransferase family 4 protein n=1 Tax=Symplocastrum torsivum CPER-KK1 TaxID=450513 RepID=A0A951PLQ2_9CYAN|nr:glycosyltransferase family 4 protein [Symplocastrum torsivum CPER-KK1]
MDIPTKQLRVLHICQRDDPATGGAVRVAAEYVKHLPNYEVDAHCLFLYGSPGCFQTELGEHRTHYLRIQNSREFLKFRRLLHFLHKFQPQIIHHHDGLLWSHLLTFSHRGVVKIAHAHLGAESGGLLSRSALAAWLQRQSTDLLIGITEDTRKSHIEQGRYIANRTQVLYNGVDRDRFYPPTDTERAIARRQFGLPTDIPVIGFVGRLHCQMKGTDDFLKAIALLPSHFWALVVGAGPDADNLKQLATTLGIAERVVFTGIVENPTPAYHSMDVFCLTSHWEPFGLVVAEAMACRVPVVGLPCQGGVNELLTPETGCVLPYRDLEAMAQAVIEAIKYPERWYQRHTKAASVLEHNHNWEKNTSRLAQLYKEVLNKATDI